MTAKLFFSYSHKDEALRDQLEVHLAMLRREGTIEAWHDRRIVAGSNVDHNVSAHLEGADIVLLLVSPDFLASEYCYDVEMERAMERHNAGHARVIPVILRPCDWHRTPFGRLLAAPKDGKPVTRWSDADEAFLDIANAIRVVAGNAEHTSTHAVRPMPAAQAPRSSKAASAPRSSNLRLRKTFSDAEKDQFIEESFEYIAQFFENSLRELTERNPGIEVRFRRVDPRHFTAVVYDNGQALSRCRVWHGSAGWYRGGIFYSMNDDGNDNSYNESLSVEASEQALRLKPIGMQSFTGGREPNLTMEGAAELYWDLFIGPLQR